MEPTYYPPAVVGLAGACLTVLGILGDGDAVTVGGIVLGTSVLAIAAMFAWEVARLRRQTRREKDRRRLAARASRQRDRSDETHAPRRLDP